MREKLLKRLMLCIMMVLMGHYAQAQIPTCTDTVRAFPYEPDFSANLACWTPSAGSTWRDTADVSGYSGSMVCVSVRNGMSQWLVSPLLQLPSDTAGLQMTWDVCKSGGAQINYLVLISNDDGQTWDTVDGSYYANQTYLQNDWPVDLVPYAGQAIRVAFCLPSTGGNLRHLFIANLVIRSDRMPWGYWWGRNASVMVGDTVTNEYSMEWGVDGDTNVSFVWQSTMVAAGQATVTGIEQEMYEYSWSGMFLPTSRFSLVYNAPGIDTMTLTVSNAYGSFTQRSVVQVFSCQPVDIFPWTLSFDDLNVCWYMQYMERKTSNYIYVDEDGDSHISNNYLYVYNNNYSYDPSIPSLVTPAIAVPANADHLALTLSWQCYNIDVRAVVLDQADGIEQYIAMDTALFPDVLYRSEETDNTKVKTRKVSLAPYAGQIIRLGLFQKSGTMNYLLPLTIDYDTLPKIHSVMVPGTALTDTSMLCTASLRYGATEGLHYTWHSVVGGIIVTNALGDSAWVTYQSGMGGMDTLTVSVTNAYGSDIVAKQVKVVDCSPAVTLPWSEDFEAGLLCWTVPEGSNWNVYQPAGKNRSVRSATMQVGTDNWLISKAVTIPADTNEAVRLFWGDASGHYMTCYYRYSVLVTTAADPLAADAVWNTLYVLDSATLPYHGSNNDNYTRHSVPLGAYAGQTVHIAFRHQPCWTHSTEGYWMELKIDDVEVRSTTAPVVELTAPAGVYADDSTLFTATLLEGSPNGLTYSWRSTLLDTIIPPQTSPQIILEYPMVGTDTLTVVATNAYGIDSATVVFTVQTFDTPVASFVSVPTTANVNDNTLIIVGHNACSPRGLTGTWHSSLLDTTIVTVRPDIDTLRLVYPMTGVDTITYTLSNPYGSDIIDTVVRVVDCLRRAPFTEDFEGVVATSATTAGNLPDCWSYNWNGSNAAYAPHVIPADGYQYISNIPNNALFMVAGSSSNNSGYGNRAEVVLPNISDSLQRLAIAFDYRFENASKGTLTVGYYNAANVFTAVQTLTAHAGSYRRDTVTFVTSSIADPDAKIALRWQFASSYYAVLIDNIEVFRDSRIQAPATVNVDSIGSSYARVTWAAVDNASAYHVRINSVVDTTVVGLSCWLTGLEGHTDYTVRVAAIVGADTGRYASAQFTTLCGAVPLPYYNNFSQGDASIDCWTQSNINVYVLSGQLYATSGLLSRPSFIITPVMNHPGNEMVVSFRLSRSTAEQDSVVLIAGVMSNPNDTATFVAIDTFVATASWMNCRFSTHGLDATPVAIAFCVGTGNDDFSAVRIDDLAIEEPIACASLLTAEATVLGIRSAQLSWQYDTYGAQPAEGVQVTLYDLTSGDSSTFVCRGTDTILNDLPLAHTFRADLRTLCGTDTAESLSVSFSPAPSVCSEVQGSNPYSHCYLLNAYRPYGYFQVLYPAELGASVDTLYGIALYYNGNTGPGVVRQLDVYIGQTSASTLLSPISVATHTLAVQNHTFAPDDHGWIKIPFTTPVALNGADNIIVTVDDNTGVDGYNDMSFKGHDAAVGGCLYYNGHMTDTTSIDPFNVTVGLERSNTIPDIQLLGNCSSDTVPPVPSCPPVSVPYSHDFTTGVTACWQIPIAMSGNSGARMDDGHVSHRVPLVSPEFDRGLQGLMVRYTVNSTSTFSPKIMIGVSDADGANVVWLDSTIALDGTHEYVYQFDNTFSLSQRHIVFYGEFISFLLSVQVDENVTCQPVSHLEVTHLTDTAATLQWTPAEWPGQWAVYLDGTLQGTTTDSTFQFTGLQSQTDYIAAVRSVCASGDTTVAISTRFTTVCPPQTLPYSMDFENEYMLDSICWHTTLYPYANYPDVYIYGTTHRELFFVAVASASSYDTLYRNYVCSPLIDPEGQDVSISFRAALYSLNANSFFEVGIMPDPADTAGFIAIGSVTPSSSYNNYIDHQFNIPAAVLPQPFCLAFRFGGSLVRCYIDDVNITDTSLVSYVLTLSVNDTAMGTVTGAGTYVQGTDVTIAAIPKEGYHFRRWSDYDTNATRIVRIDEDMELTAYFESNIYHHITVMSADETMGVVTGTGDYSEGSEVTITAVPFTGYEFRRWNDGATAPVRHIVVTSDSTFVAYFVTSTGIEEVESLQVNIYPNPASEYVTIDCNDPATVTLVDMSGRVSGEWRAESGNLVIDIAGYPAGLYYVRIAAEGGMAVAKLIVRH